MMTQAEKDQAIAEVVAMIRASGVTAVLQRPASQEDRFYEADENEFVDLETFPIDLTLIPPNELNHKIDARASVLPDLDIRPEDHIQMGTSYYRVLSVKPDVLFGALTHQTITLVNYYD